MLRSLYGDSMIVELHEDVVLFLYE